MSAPDTCRRESADDYRGELHRAGRWRVIICRDHIQFIIQSRVSSAEGGAGVRWKGCHYCTTREAILRLWRRDAGDSGEVMEQLPERAPLLHLDRWRVPAGTT